MINLLHVLFNFIFFILGVVDFGVFGSKASKTKGDKIGFFDLVLIIITIMSGIISRFLCCFLLNNVVELHLKSLIVLHYLTQVYFQPLIFFSNFSHFSSGRFKLIIVLY
ncbi:LOW QUALITY PROTEIN: hypothetical protein PanWU01x14_342390 [Parasponia andersonii]|uniref:Uncharacterized protein n=1 Tax=Parasponia andersonii TaxID=3476 RepID=A0A2P5ADR7_PARAD|nr:LOW QUALITY PROTEIN: hypothetical protein PanWU01x14_342390 [Parasponia andersonii]